MDSYSQTSNGGAIGARTQQPMRILLCNPNSTKSMTDNCVRMAQETVPSDVQIIGFTAPSSGPTAIESFSDGVLSAAAVAREIVSSDGEFDAVLVACYSDHPLIRVLREEVEKPVVGIMEASLFVARTLGNRFGIIGTGDRSSVSLEDAVRQYGLSGYCAGVKSCGLGVLELKARPQEEVLEIMCEVAKDLVAQGADTLTLGCAGMTKLKPAVQRAVGAEVQVVDGVLAGVQHLMGILRIGGKTAKAGMYGSARLRRQARGQDFL